MSETPHASDKRIVLKITGEAIGDEKQIYNPNMLKFLIEEIKTSYQKTQLIIVIGGGNIVRGRTLVTLLGLSTLAADQAGMVGTIMNARVIQDLLIRENVPARVMSAFEINLVCEQYIPLRAIAHLKAGYPTILAAGTGNCGVTTDTAAIIRAGELGAELVLKGTKVNGVYDCDPKQFPDKAQFLKKISYQEFLNRNLKILDPGAVAQAQMADIPIVVFDFFKKGNLLRAVLGEDIGSRICNA